MDEQKHIPVPEAADSAAPGAGERPRRHRNRRGNNRKPAEGGAPAAEESRGRGQQDKDNRQHARREDFRAVSAIPPSGKPDEGEAGAGGEPAYNRRAAKNRSRGKQTARPDAKDPARGPERRSRKDNSKAKRSGYGGAKRGLEDIYGTPTEADVMTLEDLRAKIVIKAADGSIPAARAAQHTAAGEPDVPAAVGSADFANAADSADSASAEDAPADETVEIVGIRFRSSGKVYSFDPRGLNLRYGDCAVVETARGPEFGEVSFANRRVNRANTVLPLRPVLRIATEQDIAHNAENRAKEKEALSICQQKIRAHQLNMKLIDAQYAFDNCQLLFYFTSDGRVDFRALVKDLASVFRTRIELRQIGIRDEAKMLGGLGACGRPLCCATFLSDVVQVSIKMAKEQNLALNSAKISGACGRLMCCLRYEADMYTEALRVTPPHGSTVRTPDGVGTVISSNPLAGTLRVVLQDMPDATPKQYSRDEVTVLARRGQEFTDKTN